MTKSTKTRKLNNHDVTYEPTYKGHPINTDEKRKLGCNKKILKKSLGLLNDATEKHNKVLFMRMDVRFPENSKEQYTTDNKQFEGFMNSFNRSLKNNKLDPSYLWVREQSKEKHQHYHLGLLLDGNKTQHIKKHIDKAEELWSKRLGMDHKTNNGLIHDCTKDRDGNQQKNGIMIRDKKKDSDSFNEAFDTSFHRISYLAKENTKGYAPKNSREFGCSQIKERKKKN